MFSHDAPHSAVMLKIRQPVIRKVFTLLEEGAVTVATDMPQ